MNEDWAPVLVFRWFRDGEGWAYHPKLEAVLPKLILHVDTFLKYRKIEPIKVRVDHGFLIGDLLRDDDCPNALAVGRSPFILCAAYLTRDVTEKELEHIRRRLEQLELPVLEGVSAKLQIDISDSCEQLQQKATPHAIPQSTGKVQQKTASLPAIKKERVEKTAGTRKGSVLAQKNMIEEAPTTWGLLSELLNRLVALFAGLPSHGRRWIAHVPGVGLVTLPSILLLYSFLFNFDLTVITISTLIIVCWICDFLRRSSDQFREEDIVD